jgi:hypothetical protein
VAAGDEEWKVKRQKKNKVKGFHAWRRLQSKYKVNDCVCSHVLSHLTFTTILSTEFPISHVFICIRKKCIP